MPNKVLTFDIEEWFHILEVDSVSSHHSWKNLESRIENNVSFILDLCKSYDIKATFFCLGWIGEQYPNLIKKIIRNGHEIGSHSYKHDLVSKSTPKIFKEDLSKSLDILGSIQGSKVKYFRAPGFSIIKNNLWAYEILIDQGIEIDSSILPGYGSHGGIDGLPEEPFRIKTDMGIIKELPVSTKRMLGRKIIFAGGGYFRFFPYFFIKSLMDNSQYVMSYFHPRDFDYEQPRLQLKLDRYFKAYFGIKNANKKFNKLMKNIHFRSISEVDKSINWSETKIININEA